MSAISYLKKKDLLESTGDIIKVKNELSLSTISKFSLDNT